MRNESSGLRIVALGALNGIIFGTLLETVLRSIFVYEKYQRSRRPSSGFSISYSPYPFEWWFLPLLSFFCVLFAAFLAYVCFAGRIKSLAWFWQIIGVFTVFNYVLSTIPYTLYHLSFIESGSEYTEFITSSILENLFMISIIYPAIAVFNFIFALILKRQSFSLS